MISENIRKVHGTPMCFKTIAELEAYQYAEEFEIDDIIHLLGVVSVGDGLGHARKVSLIDDTTGILLTDGRYANIVPNSKLSDKANKAVQIIAGKGLAGGGTIGDDVNLSIVPANDSMVVTENDVQVNTADDLATESSTRPLSAKMGKKLATEKINFTDIVNDLTTGGVNKVPSAETVKLLKQLIDAMGSIGTSHLKAAVVTSSDKKYLRCNGDSTLEIVPNTCITVGAVTFFSTAAVTLDSTDLDKGAFTVGKDYMVYACVDSNNSIKFIISTELDYPIGYTAENSKMIGGFHYGDCPRINGNYERINASGVAYGAGWEDEVYQGILPFSVFTLYHRPSNKQLGMVFCPPISKWVDIYLCDRNLLSKYRATPATGTEGFSGYSFIEQLAKVGKRPGFYSEFIAVAKGSPKGRSGTNEYCWVNEGARNPAGIIPKAVSIFGLKDCVGNVWEWGSDMINRPVNGNGSWGWYNGTQIVEGSAYMAFTDGLTQISFGGCSGNARDAGSRAVTLDSCPWYVRSSHGVRGYSDSL